MKKLTITFLVFSLCFILFGAGDSVKAAGQRELILNLIISPVHNRWNLVIKPWCDELERRTGGKVKVTPYFSQSISSLTENYESVINGLADMAEGPLNVKVGQFPLLEGVFNMNRPSRYITDGTALFRELLASMPELQEELNAVKVLAVSANCGSIIGTHDKILKSTDDFKGIKIGVSGSGMVMDKAKAMGFAVASLPPNDVYMGVERGVIDGITCDYEVLVSRRWGEVVKRCHAFSVLITPFYFVMSRDAYNSLPKDVQEIIDELSGDYSYELFSEFWVNTQMDSWKRWEKEFGGQTHYYSQEELEKIDALSQPIIDAWVQSMEEKGYPAKKLLNTFRELENKYSIPWSKGAEILQ
ncbi:TRAP transporter substrate-binding protein DctP [Deltaproteobacteria bacterium]|nr:TRAP transporter substrate-binding protein DctP [Deltaproteobacteria bacterium]